MGDNEEQPKQPDAEEIPSEKRIPVFTVIKNGSILKNIFLLDNPPSSHEEEFQMLVVGRHPDCNITLEHPSISRYHLRIHSNPSSHSLSVIDLSSVHGTWVSGKKIEPGVLVELKEGDTVRLGGSSRVYKLHWVPLNQAYDLDNPFLPPLQESKDCEEETHQDQNSLCAETVEMKSPDDDLEGLELLFSNENLNLSVNEMCQLAPLVPEHLSSTYGDEGAKENKIRLSEDQEEDKTFCGGQLDSNLVLQAAEIELPLLGEETEIGQPPVHSGNISELKEAKIPIKSDEWLNSPNIWSRRGMVASVQIHTGNTRAQSKPADISTDIEPLYQVVENEPPSDTVSVGLDENEEEFFTAEKENLTPNTHLLRSFKKMSRLEEIKQSNSCRLSPLKNDVSPYINDEKETVTTLDKENQEYIQCESISKSLLSSGEGNEEDVFTPDKENFSPRTLLRRYMKKMDKVEETKRSEPVELFSSRNVFFPDIHQQEESLHSPDRENQTHTVLQERKSEKLASNNKANFESKATIKRLPLLSLFVNSISRTKSNVSVLGDSRRSCNSVNYTRTMEQNTVRRANKMWAMVVDTNCLLHRESRKALQLLQGVKGTQLIIPSIVIRELDHMKLRSSLFRRTSEVSSALQWIEDCMENTKWWIHVQSSVEEGMPIAPTPRALPLAQFTDEWGGLPFSSAQIATPTTEDNVLECALFFRRFMIDRQLVLLSDDISLKINSMAEGVICETAEDFRESLVNPFSERFLWADSSPRGTTWSCIDDTVLRERYYPCPLKKPESLKGLKLILLHNSQYR